MKHIVPYLPYKLKIFVESDGFLQNNETFEINAITQNGVNVTIKTFPFNTDYSFDEFKIILKPLSDLNKNIDKDEDVTFLDWIISEYEIDVIAFIKVNGIERLPYEIMEYLFEWHFDVFGLREKDLCVYYDELVALKQE